MKTSDKEPLKSIEIFFSHTCSYIIVSKSFRVWMFHVTLKFTTSVFNVHSVVGLQLLDRYWNVKTLIWKLDIDLYGYHMVLRHQQSKPPVPFSLFYVLCATSNIPPSEKSYWQSRHPLPQPVLSSLTLSLCLQTCRWTLHCAAEWFSVTIETPSTDPASLCCTGVCRQVRPPAHEIKRLSQRQVDVKPWN